ncbi:carboxypeptidase regulatory-like domain-containing protein [Acidicapsa dinghuensis]|uniref:Carboxypeptidase regulatory-like domain-containing protein n=1 Tax=Acidicapsa dinghuensis TaxID=2218256 RepID=A0ABW1ECC3_9BACT|nr:carboxypeptidase regulatory-like domain-containing protein [Acidicapsa dinghuensis]
MKALLLVAIFCVTASLAAADTHPGLSGTVVDANGDPLAGVTVMVYHAGVKFGYSTFCPSCYIDCGKHAITDAKGAFKFKDLSPDLWFTLLAARDGYIPEITQHIDPFKAPTVTLKLATKPAVTDFSGTVRGRVVDEDGSPISYAVINPTGLIIGKGSTYGTVPGLEPISVSNKQGEFEISYAKPTPKMLLEVEARAFAPKFAVLETGPERHAVALSVGGTITGRLMQDGKPVSGAQIGLIAKDGGGFGMDLKLIGNPYEVVRIGTDEKGNFSIPNVPAPVDWYVYPTMDSVSSRGAVSPIGVRISKDEEHVQTADMVIEPGLYIRGTVIASDKKAIEEGMRVTLTSETVWDSQTVLIGADGHFEFKNVPAGKYAVGASVRGYHENTPRYGPEPFEADHNIDNLSITVYPNVP